jgi:hypothetical protein
MPNPWVIHPRFVKLTDQGFITSNDGKLLNSEMERIRKEAFVPLLMECREIYLDRQENHDKLQARLAGRRQPYGSLRVGRRKTDACTV